MNISAASPEKATSLLPLGALLLGFGLTSQSHAQTTLPTVEVRSTVDADPVSRYQGQTTTVGKLKQLPKDVPQALTVVTKELLQDQGAATLKDSLRNVAGLTFNSGEGGRIGDNINLRGFYSFGDLYLDGIRDVAQYNRDVFNVDQVDVLRGSAAMLFGRGQAGGVINQISKDAEREAQASASATIGSYGYKRVSLDVDRPVGEDAAVRVNAMKTDAGSSRDQITSSREGFAPTIRWGIATDNQFSLAFYHLKSHNVPDYGVPFVNGRPLAVPVNTFYGTSADYEDNTTDMTTAGFVHRFSVDSELKTVLRVADYSRDLWAVAPRLASTSNVSNATAIIRGRQARGSEEHTITSQTDFTTRFTAGGMKHEALVGLEVLKERAGRWNYGTVGGVSILAPNTTVGNANADAVLPAAYGSTVRSGTTTYQGLSTGFYGQDTLEFAPHWKLLLGLRRDQMDADYSNGAKVNYGEFSYRTGLSYQPNDESHYYAAWSDSFNPTADLYQFSPATGALEPERSRTYELGAKWELLEGDLSLRTSLYRTEKFWERNTDAETATTNALLSKKRHTDGLELEAAGRISKRWEVFAGLALMRALVDQAAPGRNPNYAGMRARNAPPYTFNLWTTYKLDGGWKLGAGVEGKGDRLAYSLGSSATSPVVPNIAPRYQRFDALIAYEQARYSVRLNLLNLTDRRYYDAVYENGGFVVPGTRRAVQLTTEFKF